MKNQIWNNIIHILAGVALGYLMGCFLFSCKSSKAGCDAYTQKIEQHENKSRK